MIIVPKKKKINQAGKH